MIIGLSGTLCSGKDTVAKHLVEDDGFFHISLSQILRDLAEKENIPHTMVALTQFGNSLNETHGLGYLAKLALARVKEGENTVISSIRQPSEIDVLRKINGFKMLFVDADQGIRFERLRGRNRQGDSEKFEEFVELEAMQNSGNHGGMNLRECKQNSDYVIENNSTMDDFLSQIEDVKNKIKGAE